MVDLTDENAKQARQGSVAAIIQLLNEYLADCGIRTRAVRENGILQLLCEAESAYQLDRDTLVPRIKEILETIGPKNIRRVRINSRIMREQQLLWLEEINRDPVHQLLWYEDITLARRNPFKKLAPDWKDRKNKSVKQALPKASNSAYEPYRRQLHRETTIGVLISLSVVVAGWFVYKFLATPKSLQPEVTRPGASLPVASNNPNANGINAANQTSGETSDSFVVAVRMAEQASLAGKTAQTRAQWLEIANRWQKASDLMSQVPESDRRYKTAQNRMRVYRQNSESALRQLQKRRS